jgi:tRNA dimethylallyltransferase
MMELGAVEEAQALMARGLDPALPSMRAHGIPGLIDWLSGRIRREEAITRGQADTRHYARRQFTFARRQLPGFIWISLQENPQAALDVALKGLDGSCDP